MESTLEGTVNNLHFVDCTLYAAKQNKWFLDRAQ